MFGRAPRLLEATAELHRLKEMNESDWCCGMGGSFNVQHYDDISKDIGNEKGEPGSRRPGRRCVATGCPACMLQISDMSSPERGRRLPCGIPMELYAEDIEKQMKLQLETDQAQTHFRQVFEQLRELIFSGGYQPGQRIMTERELAEALKVSRSSVREAINKLVTLRFLEHRQGQGTFVCTPDEAVQIPMATVMETQDASLIDLLELRLGIECNAAALAARRASAQDLETIEKALAQMAGDIEAGGLGTQGDLPFT